MSSPTSFANPDSSFVDEAAGLPFTAVNPATGITVTMSYSQRMLYVANGSTLAALTVKLPLGVRNGDFVGMLFESAVTALTVEHGFGAPADVTGAPTAAAASTSYEIVYLDTTIDGTAVKGWFRYR